MALTAEQQNQLEFEDAREASRRSHELLVAEKQRAHELLMEQTRHANAAAIAALSNERQATTEKHQEALQAAQARLELIRVAKETLVENRRTKPASTAADISSNDIVAFASSLGNHVNS